MRNRFRYTPPGPFNGLTHGALVLGAVFVLSRWGDALWAALLGRLGPAGTFVGLGFLVYLGLFWLVGGAYLLLDHLDRPAWLTRYRIQIRPPGVSRRGPTLRKAVGVVLRNQLLGTLPALVVLFGFLRWRGLDMAAPLPPWWRMLLDLGLLVAVEEVLFYAVHRLLHRPALFRSIHRVHHEFRETIGITTHYVHFAEHLAGNLLPFFAGMALFMPHPAVFFVWMVMVVVNAIHTHGGYAFPWMSWGVDHDFHHYNVNGCYGTIAVLDRLFGTDAEIRAFAEKAVEGTGPDAVG